MGLSSVCQVLVCLSESEVVSTQNREEVEEAPDYKLPNLDLATLHHLNATVYRRRQGPEAWGQGDAVASGTESRTHLLFIYLLGMPETSLRGLSTRIARNVRRSTVTKS
jgi:hypothetical protein